MTQTAFPPVARSRLPGGMFWRFQRDRLGAVEELARELGDLVQLPLPGKPFFLVSHPDDIRQVLERDHRRFTKSRGLENAALVLGRGLLTSEGQLHARQRRLMMPAFHREKILAYGADMVARTEERAAGWQAGQQVDMAAEMMHLTRRIVARSLFGYEPAGADEVLDRALSALVGSFGAPGVFLVPLPWVERGWLPGTGGLASAKATLDRVVYGMIARRREADQPGDDLLGLLLQARDEEGQGMSDHQLRDEVLTLFLAGHETTANALTWTLYLLGEHPEAMARLQAELDRVLDGRPPRPEDLPELTYTRQVLTESMRLYPPAWMIGRRATSDLVLGGYGIPRGATILMSQWVVHRDPRWHAQPERFRPERWAEPAAGELPKYAYFPFGGGPRRCIGEAFAWMEGILILATIARRWSPSLVPGHPVEPQPLITLRPRHGMQMRLARRDLGPEPAAWSPARAEIAAR